MQKLQPLGVRVSFLRHTLPHTRDLTYHGRLRMVHFIRNLEHDALLLQLQSIILPSNQFRPRLWAFHLFHFDARFQSGLAQNADPSAGKRQKLRK